jgi:predicted DsbA family dithiol-disulfide isomerase
VSRRAGRPDLNEPIAPTRIFLYGHYACPHTFIAQGRLDVLASEAPVVLGWRPLAPPSGQVERDWSGIAGPGESASDVLSSLRRDAAALGLTLGPPPSPPDPRLALQAAEFARDCGPAEFDRFHRLLFRAVFEQGHDIAARDLLLELGEQVGLDREGLGAALEDARYESALEDVEQEAARYAIDATPTLLVGRYKLVGAAPLEVLRETLARAAEPPDGGGTGD